MTNEWQPIETAPKDGSAFCTYSPPSPDGEYGESWDTAFYDHGMGAFIKSGCGWQFATHWSRSAPKGEA